VRHCRFQIDFLQIKTRDHGAVLERDLLLQGRIMADGLQGLDRFAQLHVRRLAVLDHGEDQRRGAQPKVRGDLAQIRISNDDVQPAVLVRDGVRFIPGIDDGAPDGRFQPYFCFEKVCPLADLEAPVPAGHAQAYPARAANDLPGDEERDQPGHYLPEG
jgi:hypothetical protein